MGCHAVLQGVFCDPGTESASPVSCTSRQVLYYQLPPGKVLYLQPMRSFKHVFLLLIELYTLLIALRSTCLRRHLLLGPSNEGSLWRDHDWYCYFPLEWSLTNFPRLWDTSDKKTELNTYEVPGEDRDPATDKYFFSTWIGCLHCCGGIARDR